MFIVFKKNVALERLLADAIGDQGNMKKRNRKRGYVK
jgi:hypothetical protein